MPSMLIANASLHCSAFGNFWFSIDNHTMSVVEVGIALMKSRTGCFKVTNVDMSIFPNRLMVPI